MHRLLEQLTSGIQLTGDVRSDTATFLFHHGIPDTLDHCARVAVEAKRLAARFGAHETQAQVAGWLHDISAVFPVSHRAQIARNLGLEVLPEEDKAPMLLHQRLSAVVAGEVFGVTDEAVLSAIECHTTLRVSPALLDKVVFVADKIQWDQQARPPYLTDLLAALEQSLDQAALWYLRCLWQRRDSLPAIHPWFVAAYRQLSDATC